MSVPVYDLTVEGEHEFFANGVLVHNSTEGGDGAETAGVLMHAMRDGTYTISDVAHGHWGALDREAEIKKLAKIDAATYPTYCVVVEQEPGSGGKESAEATIRNLPGYSVFADKVTGSKEVRAEPFAAQVQGGNVYLIAAPWNYQFLNEAELFPNGPVKDMIDAAAGGFNKLIAGAIYDSTYEGWN